MEIMRHGEEDSTMRLFEASMRGCVSTLNDLVQNDPLILDRLSLTSLCETPLHIASLRGHLDFVIALLTLKPNLAIELDSSRRSPLHLASAEGHAKIVKALLESTCDRSDVCLIRDEDGRIALHLSAMRGRVDAMEELVKANSNSVKVLLHGESVLHLCVRYNHLEALKFLVSKLGNECELLNFVDLDGNTILHLAVKLHQIETVKYLLSLPGVRARANVYDVLEESPKPKDLKSFQIRDILVNQVNDGQRRFTPPPCKGGTPPPQTADLRPEYWYPWTTTRLCTKIRQYLTCRTDWIDLAHGNFMVVATVIATMSFAAATNPPGGVWQEDTTDGDSCKHTCKAGTAVLAYGESKKSYKFFFICNTISYMASLSVILLHFAGFGLKKRIGMWLLIVTMCTMLTSMLLTFLEASWLVTPDDFQSHVEKTYKIVSTSWLILLACVCLNHSIQFFYWTCFGKVPKCVKMIRYCLRNREVGA